MMSGLAPRLDWIAGSPPFEGSTTDVTSVLLSDSHVLLFRTQSNSNIASVTGSSGTSLGAHAVA